MEEKLIQIIKETCQESRDFIGDDCAVIELGKEKYLVSQDNFAEDIHFSTEYYNPADIGWKSLAVNISDIAAMGGDPLFFTVGISLNKEIADKETWIKEFYTGINECAAKFGNPKLVGGDISGSKAGTVISITIFGKADTRGIFYRHTAKAGDLVCVSGDFGASSHFLNNIKTSPHKQKHLRPEPQLNLAKEIFKTVDTGTVMDASDGLAQALWEISQKSNKNIFIDAAKVPKAADISMSEALYGGEDYQLVGTFKKVPDNFALIGKVESLNNEAEARAKVIELTSNEILLQSKIFNHF